MRLFSSRRVHGYTSTRTIVYSYNRITVYSVQRLIFRRQQRAHIRGGTRAAVAGFQFAGGRAAVSTDGVAIIAAFGSGHNAVAAGCRAGAGASVADVAALHFAGGGATVSIFHVFIVTLLFIQNHPVATLRFFVEGSIDASDRE